MSYAKDLYKKLLDLPSLTDMFPLLYIKGDHTVVAKDGTFSAILELQGLDYSGMKSNHYDLLFNVRKRLFEKESPFYRIDVVSKKNRVSAKDKINTDVENPILHMLKKTWREKFDVLYRSKHYIVISVNNASIMSKVGAIITDDYKIDKADELWRLIQEITSDLQEYTPVLLKTDKLSSFYATQLNGRETYLNARVWDQPLSNQPVKFNAGNNYCTYGLHGDTVYSGWLSISRYSEEITRHTLERIFKLPYRFNIYQSFKTYQKSQALGKFEQRAKEVMNWGDDNDFFVEQLVEFSDKISADKVSLVSHCFAIEVLADSPEELNNTIRLISNAITSDGQMQLYRETRNIESLFWSRFPTMQGFNLRKRDLSSENAAHLATFNCVGEGFDSCGFGDRPVTLFKTEEGGQFSFTFHQSGEQKPDVLGHTLVIGGTGTGKTTFISFLIANCLDYDDFKAICFDRHGGLKVFTDMFDGDYLDFPDDVEMNPFQMPDSSVNRMFLFQWLKRLGGIKESDNKWNSDLNDLISMNYQLDKKDRNFENIAIGFGVEGSELYQLFEQWLPDGARGDFFNGSRDSLNFDKDIVTFDATYILDQPEILPKITDYVFHQMISKVSREVTPHIVFFDESPRYFLDPIFAGKMLESLAEIRKKAGVCVLAAQNPTQLINLENGNGEKVINALANIICYPNPSATKEEYCDFLGFNETELEWIKTTSVSDYKIIVKNRATDSSVILDVGLAGLKTNNYNLLKCFDSSSSAVNRLKDFKKSDPINYKLKFLRS